MTARGFSFLYLLNCQVDVDRLIGYSQIEAASLYITRLITTMCAIEGACVDRHDTKTRRRRGV